jgi:hypothetical protein
VAAVVKGGWSVISLHGLGSHGSLLNRAEPPYGMIPCSTINVILRRAPPDQLCVVSNLWAERQADLINARPAKENSDTDD